MDLMITNKDKTLRAVQELELKGLKEVDRICRKYDIKYSLGGGTCLGQIRHGGFIPWDDDIDIDMTVENFQKFVEACKTELNPNLFYLHSRETDPQYLRSCARLELRNTGIALGQWDKRKDNIGIFVDIFQWSYLPNNTFLRKLVAGTLFYIRCIENNKMYHTVARRANVALAPLIIFCGKCIPFKWILALENKLLNCCKGKKTDWIIDDAIINGNHGGYPSEGIDEYTDVQFEGLTVMNKKNPDNFMRTIYGEHYGEWLSPSRRISHHKWTRVDLGVYADEFDLPENYSDYLSIKYNETKVKQMKKVSLEMLSLVHDICEDKGWKYYLLGKESVIYALNLDELTDLWMEPFNVCLPRADYEKFVTYCENLNDPKFYLQNVHTEPEYEQPHSRLRLNYTLIRENCVLGRKEEKINAGFYLNIYPMDEMPKDEKTRNKHLKKLRYLYRFIEIKSKGTIALFVRRKWVAGAKYLVVKPFSNKTLQRKLEKNLRKYNGGNNEYYHIPYCHMVISKEALGEGTKCQYQGQTVVFPSEEKKYYKEAKQYLQDGEEKEWENLVFIKEKFPKQYQERYMPEYRTKIINTLKKRYAFCFLNFYEADDYQLSILRYDEKKDCLMTNDEVYVN